MPPTFRPAPLDSGPPPIHIAAVRERMLAVAGEVAGRSSESVWTAAKSWPPVAGGMRSESQPVAAAAVTLKPLLLPSKKKR